jgi:hypothetical protein
VVSEGRFEYVYTKKGAPPIYIYCEEVQGTEKYKALDTLRIVAPAGFEAISDVCDQQDPDNTGATIFLTSKPRKYIGNTGWLKVAKAWRINPDTGCFEEVKNVANLRISDLM